MTVEVLHSPVVIFVGRRGEPDFGLPAHAGEWEARHYVESEPLDELHEAIRREPTPSAAVIDAGSPQALTAARHVHRAAPMAQLVFVCDAKNEQTFHRAVRLSPVIGAHWVELRRDDPAFADKLREQIRLGERRLRHRLAIDRVNAQLHAHTRMAVDQQTLRRLALSERCLTAIVQHSPDAILTLNPSGGVLSWNTSAEHIWGWRASDVIGRNLADFLAPESRTEFAHAMRSVARIRQHLRNELHTANHHGGSTPLEMTIAPVFDDDGELLACSIVARDITQRRKAEQIEREHRMNLEHVVAERTAQLRETVAHLEQFSYTISHDLRGPIRAIQGYAEILRDDFTHSLDQDGRSYLERIIRASERMEGLIRDVLNYSRVATEQLEKQPVDTDAIVTEIIGQLPEEVRRRADIVVEGPLPCVIGHPALVSQALNNLIGNALKFVKPGTAPAVRVWAQPSGDCIRLHVADRGIGVAPEFREKIFGLFERGTTSNGYQGTGVGLAIVKKSIERLGGRVGYESTPGEGTVFWIELPGCTAN